MRGVAMAGLVVLVARSSTSADPPTAAEIVNEMTATYANARTYQDTGETTETVGGRRGWTTHFMTAFGGGGLRLELRLDDRNTTSYVIWSDFHHVLVAMGNDIADSHELGETLGESSKLTQGLSSAVLPLLLPAVSGAQARSLADLALVGAERVDGHNCWHLEHRDLALWIDQDSHLLRKRTETAGSRITTLVFEPVIGAPIAPYKLARPTLEPTLEPADRARLIQLKAEEALIGRKAPPFTADRVSGHYPTKLDLLSGHVVVLALMGSWCLQCGQAAEELRKIDRDHAKDGVRTLALSSDDTATIARFGTHHVLDYTLARDDLGAIKRAYHLDGLPSVVIIDRSGIVRDVMLGVPSLEIEAAIARLVHR